MQLPQGNPKLPDDINNKDQKPLLDFLLLAAGVVAGLLLLSVVLLKSAQWLAPHVPYQWERDWFASLPETEEDSASNAVTSADQTADQASNYTKEQALNALMSRLLAGQAAPLPVTLHWLEEDMPNAFATVGGHIFVTSGLLQQVSSENALAMVLAHEYAHVKLRHPITLVAEQLSLTTLNLLIGNSSASALTQQGGWLALLSYSRDMERAADRMALDILQQHYGHTEGAAEFFDHMLSQQAQSAWQEMFQTHPMTSERLQMISASNQPARTQTPLTPLPNPLK